MARVVLPLEPAGDALVVVVGCPHPGVERPAGLRLGAGEKLVAGDLDDRIALIFVVPGDPEAKRLDDGVGGRE